jgi:hypothetical protein
MREAVNNLKFNLQKIWLTRKYDEAVFAAYCWESNLSA